jgi:hypothetical protein
MENHIETTNNEEKAVKILCKVKPNGGSELDVPFKQQQQLIVLSKVRHSVQLVSSFLELMEHSSLVSIYKNHKS